MRFSGTSRLVALLVAAAPGARAATCPPSGEAPLAETVHLRDLGERLRGRVDACATDARKADGEALYARHGLEPTTERLRAYTRARTVFEMTRDGGPFRLRWAITDKDPTSRFVWEAWRARPPLATSTGPSATAECDEISALFASLSRRIGVRGIGLFWPTNNHTVAAWDLAPGQRVMIPTTQIFQSCEATFDATTFSPTKQRTVYEMSESDVPDTFAMPRATASFLLDRVAVYAGASLEVLEVLRLDRALRYGSSVPRACEARLRSEAARLRSRTLSSADRAALLSYGRSELGRPADSPEQLLERLAGAS